MPLSFLLKGKMMIVARLRLIMEVRENSEEKNRIVQKGKTS